MTSSQTKLSINPHLQRSRSMSLLLKPKIQITQAPQLYSESPERLNVIQVTNGNEYPENSDLPTNSTQTTQISESEDISNTSQQQDLINQFNRTSLEEYEDDSSENNDHKTNYSVDQEIEDSDSNSENQNFEEDQRAHFETIIPQQVSNTWKNSFYQDLNSCSGQNQDQIQNDNKQQISNIKSSSEHIFKFQFSELKLNLRDSTDDYQFGCINSENQLRTDQLDPASNTSQYACTSKFNDCTDYLLQIILVTSSSELIQQTFKSIEYQLFNDELKLPSNFLDLAHEIITFSKISNQFSFTQDEDGYEFRDIQSKFECLMKQVLLIWESQSFQHHLASQQSLEIIQPQSYSLTQIFIDCWDQIACNEYNVQRAEELSQYVNKLRQNYDQYSLHINDPKRSQQTIRFCNKLFAPDMQNEIGQLEDEQPDLALQLYELFLYQLLLRLCLLGQLNGEISLLQ
ncbi:UNKNOWN [Stylonychia lemnae]|uniref:Uncharacterized protein n=1 Tax=Stylonychia lemnae TaxID=5949 RepID=A0A078BB15_STYLE|nr:UNKNOWN [Stylonychia lemnae]|eukprot:CDW90437.1 UNKNOWN [Stylonychia lemnae]